MLQYQDINCKTVTILFYSLIIQLMVYKKTITRFIADNKVVYQRVRWDMRLASDNSWARRRLKHLIWRSRWIILCTFEQRIAVSCKISRADRRLFGLSTWLSTRSLRDEYGLLLRGCRTIVSVLWILLSRLSMLPIIVRKFIARPPCTISFWQIEILNQNLIFLWNFHDFD